MAEDSTASSSMDTVQTQPTTGATVMMLTDSKKKPLNAAGWRELTREAMARSQTPGASFKAWIDRTEAEILKEQAINDRFGIERDEELSGSDDEDEDGGAEEEEEEEEEEGSDLADEDSEEEDDNPLPPVTDSILAQDYTAEDADTASDWMSLASDVSEGQDEIDNCDVHSASLVCTCRSGDIQFCDLHRWGRSCTCRLGAEEDGHGSEGSAEEDRGDSEDMTDLEYDSRAATMPTPRAGLREEEHFTRSNIEDDNF